MSGLVCDRGFEFRHVETGEYFFGDEDTRPERADDRQHGKVVFDTIRRKVDAGNSYERGIPRPASHEPPRLPPRREDAAQGRHKTDSRNYPDRSDLVADALIRDRGFKSDVRRHDE